MGDASMLIKTDPLLLKIIDPLNAQVLAVCIQSNSWGDWIE